MSGFNADIWSLVAIAVLVSGGWSFVTLTARWQWAMDEPNERSLHGRPVPRSGGLGILLAIVVTGMAAPLISPGFNWPWHESLLAVALGAISFIDDKRGLSASFRLVAQLAGALVYAFFVAFESKIGHVPWPAWILYAGLLFAIVGMSNFYNFMDGANGLAGSMALVGFGAFAIALTPSHADMAALCLTLSGAALGFLAFNLRGRIFMGDCGSVPLGALAACIGFTGWLFGVWSLGFPLLVFAPFIVDATITLLKRLFRGEKVWLAHREHYYQRVIRMGASHTQLAVGEISLMLICSGSALTLNRWSVAGQVAIFATIGLLLILVMVLIDKRWQHHLSKHIA